MRYAPTMTKGNQHQRSLSESGIEDTKAKGNRRLVRHVIIPNYEYVIIFLLKN